LTLIKGAPRNPLIGDATGARHLSWSATHRAFRALSPLFLISADSPVRRLLVSKVLVHVGRYAEIGRNVVIAWKAGRESSRAVFDALPILKQAERSRSFSSAPTTGNGSAGPPGPCLVNPSFIKVFGGSTCRCCANPIASPS
jgi:hypothetical protein